MNTPSVDVSMGAYANDDDDDADEGEFGEDNIVTPLSDEEFIAAWTAAFGHEESKLVVHYDAEYEESLRKRVEERLAADRASLRERHPGVDFDATFDYVAKHGYADDAYNDVEPPPGYDELLTVDFAE